MTKTYSAVYVTATKKGPRFHSFARGRMFPMSRDVAEASFAAGATVYRKQPGAFWAVVDQLKVIEA